MDAALPLRCGGGAQTQIGLVNERCRVQSMARPLAAQVAGRDAPQIAVDDGKERGDRVLIASSGVGDQLGDG
jgi:hypothetical protein